MRIADDLRATAGRELVLRLRNTDVAWWEIDVLVDGKHLGSLGQGFSTDPEDLIAELADNLRENFLDEEIWGGWPICPDHGDHPLEPGVDDAGRATWFCPRGRAVAAIGALSTGT